MTALYSSGPIATNSSQPGMAFERMAGSRNPDQTWSRGAAISVVPSIFIGSPHGFEGAERTTSDSQSGHTLISYRCVHQEDTVDDVDVADGAEPQGRALGIVETDQPALEIVPPSKRHGTGLVRHDPESQAWKREPLRAGTFEIAIESGRAMATTLAGRSTPHMLPGRHAYDLRTLALLIRAHDRLTLLPALYDDHEIGIEAIDLPLLVDPAKRYADQPAGVHDHPVEPLGERSIHHVPRGRERRPDMALG